MLFGGNLADSEAKTAEWRLLDSLGHLSNLSQEQAKIMLSSSELSAYKKHSIVFNPRKDAYKADDEVKYLRPCHVKTFVDPVYKVEVVSRHQTII